MIHSPKRAIIKVLIRDLHQEPDGTHLAYLESVRQQLGYDTQSFLRLIYDSEFILREQIFRQAAVQDAEKSIARGKENYELHEFISYGDSLYKKYMESGYPYDSIYGINSRSRIFKFTVPGLESDYSISLRDFQFIQIVIEQYRKKIEGQTNQETPQTTNKDRHETDRRKNNKQEGRIDPEPAFWEEVRDYTKKYKMVFWKNKRGNPTERFFEHLLEKKFVGHLVSDRTKENPIPLSRYIIRERLIDFFHK